jgi:hypothetical protein
MSTARASSRQRPLAKACEIRTNSPIDTIPSSANSSVVRFKEVPSL